MILQCDETKPICHNCTSRQLDCIYPPPEEQATPQRRSVSKELLNPSTASSRPSSTPSPLYPSSSTSSSAISHPHILPPIVDPERHSTYPQYAETLLPIGCPTHLSDLSLMHHFVTRTSSTLTGRKDIQLFWQRDAPVLAFLPEYSYLLSAILATAAAHRAVTHTSGTSTTGTSTNQSDSVTGASYHHKTLISFRDAMARLPTDPKEISTETSAALFATSTLIALYALAMTDSDTRGGDTELAVRAGGEYELLSQRIFAGSASSINTGSSGSSSISTSPSSFAPTNNNNIIPYSTRPIFTPPGYLAQPPRRRLCPIILHPQLARPRQ